MIKALNANALYKEIRKKHHNVPYIRVSVALEGSPSGLDSDQAKHLNSIIDKICKEAKENVLKSIKPNKHQL